MDLAVRLKTLKKDIEDSRILQASLKATQEKEEENLRDIVKEIKALGFNPKTLKEDVVKLETEIEEKLTSKEKDIKDIKETLEDIERNLKVHE